MKVVIVGGGTAGWLCAALIAAKHQPQIVTGQLTVTLIESANTPTLGVGEGTWPSMRATLRTIGISETAFLLACDATFKQGSTFLNWIAGDDRYHHPFSPPDRQAAHQHEETNVEITAKQSSQVDLIRHHRTPKLLSATDYEFTANYGYHLDADKFVALLQQHCTSALGVLHQYDDIATCKVNHEGNLLSVLSLKGASYEGDLFIDCSGAKGLLINGHYNVGLTDVSHILPNNCAIACRVPYNQSDAPIYSSTRATATPHGWIWDIGLQSRRGVGHVFSTKFSDKTSVEAQLREYIEQDPYLSSQHLCFKEIRFSAGYRTTFWRNNCVAVGMAAGFIEPLEATALALVEQSALFIASHLTSQTALMEAVSQRFNRLMAGYWQEVVDFLKLHYTLSTRNDSPYWREVKSQDSLPASLKEKLLIWQALPASIFDTEMRTPLFSHNSFHYVLTGARQYLPAMKGKVIEPSFNHHLVNALPTQRRYFEQLHYAKNKVKKYA